MNSDPSDNDLLLAVRYVTDECDAVEAAAFEDRLAGDTAAQNALVEATQIVAMLKATPSCPQFAQPMKKRQWGVGSGQWGAILASCVVVAVGILWTLEPGPEQSGGIAMLEESPVLAQAWTALADEPAEAADNDDDMTEESNDVAADVPDWLLTAVMVEQGEVDENAQNLDEETQL